MELAHIISSWLGDAKLMQLATASNNQPWVCTVGFVSDDNFNIFWFSRNSRRHSREIMKNGQVAATIVNDIAGRQAIQLTGVAAKLPLEQAPEIHAMYKAKLGIEPVSLADLGKSTEVSFWRLTPTLISTWDEVNFADNPKREYGLPE